MDKITYLTVTGDSWQLSLRQGKLYYNYTAAGEPPTGLRDYKAAIDADGQLHMVVILLNERLIYARWRGSYWESKRLPLKGSISAFAVDSHRQPHILLETSLQEIYHFYLEDNCWRRQPLPFQLTAPPLLFQSLGTKRLLLTGRGTSGERQQIFLASFSPDTGWKTYHYAIDTEPGNEIYAYWYKEYLFLLTWCGRETDYTLCLNIINLEKGTDRKIYPEGTVELPDDRPVLLAEEKKLLFLWTSSNRLTFCFSQDDGNTWSPPQSAYFFFPARIKAIEGPYGPSIRQVAFTKIDGLEPDWPLVINFEPLFSLCRANTPSKTC